MAHLPYQTDTSGTPTKVWVFSALVCKCTSDDMEMALQSGTISQFYKDQLDANTHQGTEPVKPSFWKDVP